MIKNILGDFNNDNKTVFKSFFLLFIKIMIIVFLCEALVMAIFYIIKINGYKTIFIDPIILSLMVTPFFFYLIIKKIESILAQHKKAEDILKEAEQRFRTIFDSANDGILVIDPETELCCFANNTFSQMVGYTHQELKDLSVKKFHPREMQTYIIELFMKQLNGTLMQVKDIPMIRKDGSRFYVDVNPSIITLSGKKYLMGIIRDITEFREKENALRLSENKYKTLLENLPQKIFLKDRNSVYLSCNENYARDLKIKPGDIGGKVDYEFYPRELAEKYRKDDRIIMKSEKTKDIEEKYIQNGKKIIIHTVKTPVKDDRGTIIGILGIFWDITEQKKAEEAFKRSSKTINDIIENAPFGIYVVNEKENIELVNAKMIKIFKTTREQFISMNIFELPTYKKLGISKKIKDCINGKYFRFDSMEYTTIYSKETTFSNIVGIPLEEDGEKKALIIVEDITEKKKVEEDLIRTQKLESVGTLAGGIAHDFNNILNVILGNISLAKMLSEPGSKVFERLEKAEQTSSYAKDLTNQLLTFSKGGTPIKKLGTIAEIIKGTAPMVLSGTNIKSKLLLKDNLWFAEFDHGQIRQVINNLLINATEAMPKGGTVTIKAENTVVRKGNTMALPAGNYVKFEIKDTGRGISKEHLSKIFDPYFTMKPGGSGLGLSTCYSVLKKHNGYIDVVSTYNKGSIFTVYLPASEEKIIPEKKKIKKIRRGEGRILVMDDDASFREVTEELFRNLGYEVSLAREGVEAVNLYKKALTTNRPYKAVIMDLIVIDGTGGKEATEHILKLDPEAKVIVCSGYSSDPVMANFREYGFSSVLSKPFSVEELGEALYNVIKE